MAKIELDLLENATDSLNEALTKYTEGKNGNLKAFKFAILHFSHFFELLLKFYVSESHPLLIYKNPFSKRIEKENTIGIWDAVQFLQNEGYDVSKQFEDDLRWFKELRNDIEHYRFSLDTEEAKATLGRLMQTINEFNETVVSFELKDYVDKELISEFEILADEYKAKVAKAVESAERVGGAEDGYYCSWCGIAGTMSLTDGVYKCHFCDEECDEVECSVCGCNIPENEGQIWNEDGLPHVDYICDSCADKIAYA